jgi:DNA-binding transcriptional MerR regulator
LGLSRNAGVGGNIFVEGCFGQVIENYHPVGQFERAIWVHHEFLLDYRSSLTLKLSLMSRRICMKISEVAKRCGLNPSRIRFYEAKGLLKAVVRRPNGYRNYPADAILILKIITSAQRAGFSLDEIQGILPADLSTWEHDELLEGLQRKIKDIEAMQARLKKVKSHLQKLVQDIKSKPEVDYAEHAKSYLEGICKEGNFADLEEPIKIQR